MVMAERLEVIAPNNMEVALGLQPYTLNMQLLMDIIGQDKIAMAICSNEKSYYDCIIHSFASIMLMH